MPAQRWQPKPCWVIGYTYRSRCCQTLCCKDTYICHFTASCPRPAGCAHGIQADLPRDTGTWHLPIKCRSVHRDWAATAAALSTWLPCCRCRRLRRHGETQPCAAAAAPASRLAIAVTGCRQRWGDASALQLLRRCQHLAAAVTGCRRCRRCGAARRAPTGPAACCPPCPRPRQPAMDAQYLTSHSSITADRGRVTVAMSQMRSMRTNWNPASVCPAKLQSSC